MARFETTGAGKGSADRTADHGLVRDRIGFIFGVTKSYRQSPDGADCALRGCDKGKCWGEVIEVLAPNGDPVTVCGGHVEHHAHLAGIPGSRSYINEPK